jgi:uncharacterized repeat protein (TIGR03803 family)
MPLYGILVGDELMRATIPVLLALIGLLLTPVSAHAATPQVLWSFCTAHFCTDGAHPTAGVIVDKFGDVFGTTAGDLQSDPNGDPHKSTVFGVGPGVSLAFGSPYYRFVEFCSAINCTDGAQAASNIIGTVSTTSVTAYGTTVTGGTSNGGAIFKATLTAHQTIYSFCGKTDSFSSCADGSRPGDIVEDAAGNIYGTTQAGGANAGSPSGPGVLYKLDTKGVLTVLHDFCSASKCTDGVQPYGRQLALHNNALYGTAYTGGKFNNAGVVFRYDLGAKTFDVLYDFCKRPSCADGQYPQAGVTFDPVTGTLYGTTQAGGKGVLYAITNPTGNATAAASSFVLIKQFCSAGGSCTDGTSPGWAPAPDGAGNLIGATYGGGASGAGVIYEATNVNQAKTGYKVLYSFCPGGHCDTGAYPEGSLTLFPQGKAGAAIPWTSIYGVTIYGGTNNGVPNGGGTVFKLTP